MCQALILGICRETQNVLAMPSACSAPGPRGSPGVSAALRLILAQLPGQ